MLPARKNYDQNWLPDFFNDFFDTDWISRTNGTAPAINVIEEENGYRLEAAVPGMKKEDFNIQLSEDNMLVISMEHKSTDEEKKEEKKYLRREFSYSKFEEKLYLPEDVDKEKITASCTDGVLTIEIPKMSLEQKKKACKMIEIK